MPRSRRAALLLAAASPARCLLAPHAATRTQTRRNLATTPDEISHAAHYNAYDYNADSQNANEDDWRSMATAAGAMEEDPAEKWAGLFTPWDASQETAAEDTSLEKIYAVQRDPVNLPPIPQQNFGGMFSPWSDEDDSLDKIYAVQSDPVAQVVPHYEVGFEPEEVPQAGVAPWNAIQA